MFAPFAFPELADTIPESTLRYRQRKMGLSRDKAAFYRSRAQRARDAGLKPSTVRARMKRRGWTFEQALAFTSDLSPRGANTITQRALAAGKCVSTIHRRMVHHGMTLDEALAIDFMPKNPIKPHSLAQRAITAGLEPQLVQRRVRSGWPLKRALTVPPRPCKRIE